MDQPSSGFTVVPPPIQDYLGDSLYDRCAQKLGIFPTLFDFVATYDPYLRHSRPRTRHQANLCQFSIMSLAKQGKTTFKHFAVAIHTLKTQPNFYTTAHLQLLETEKERFEIWAVDLGLLVPGHGSLDYRLSEAESLSTTLTTFLLDLNDNLQELSTSFQRTDPDLALTARSAD